jgi:hypothetical protein
MKISATLAPALCLVLAACDQSLSFVCPDSQQPAVLLQVIDAATELSVADQATGWWRVGNVTDSLRHTQRPSGGQSIEGTTQLAAFGPAGVYQIRVQRPGHAEWVRTDLVVSESECGPATVRLTAVSVPVNAVSVPVNVADEGD